ncbi:ABC transporter substrate-binding protein [Candidatus Chlorohelix sp.]|uniref:ABC transporter substrate-binding protein n=1 Tax=Candidatus Chlorohelix sp. TaxID=3139201 RepID=UPI0030682BBC
MQLVRFLLAILVLNLILGACTEETVSVVTPEQPTPQHTQAAVNGTPASATEITTPANFKPDREFIFGLSQEPVAFMRTSPNDPSTGIGLDPANLVDQPSLIIVRQIFDTLFEFKPGSMQYQYASLLKPDGFYISEDGLTYTIRIGGGLVFSDGTPLDAESLRWNFIRWSNPNSVYHKGDFSTYRNFFVDLPGYPGYPGILDMDRLEVPNSRTLVVHLKAPMPNFFQVLSMPQFAIVSQSSFDKEGNFIKPVGSGAYMVDKPYDRRAKLEQRYMTLKKNPNYSVEKDPNMLPARAIETIVLKVLPGNQDGLRALRSGEISATDKIKPEDVTANLNDPIFEIKHRLALNIAFLGINQTRAPFDLIEVRQALAYGINTAALVGKYYQGLGTIASGFLPPSALSFRSDLKSYPYDPQKARDLLAQVGYINGITTPIDLWVIPVSRLYYPDPGKIAQAIVDDLAKINIKIVLHEESSWVNFNPHRDDGRYTLYMGGWQGENGDPEEFLFRFFGEERKDLGYNNPVVRKWLKVARNENNLVNRRPLYSQVTDQLLSDIPLLPLAYVDWPVAVRRDINGYEPSPNGIENWAYLSFN